MYMLRVLYSALLLTGYGTGQEVLVKMDNGTIDTFALEEMANIRFLPDTTGPVVTAPRATGRIAISGVLARNNGPFFGEDPCCESVWELDNASGDQANIVFRYYRIDDDTWKWKVIDLADVRGTGFFSSDSGYLGISDDWEIAVSETWTGQTVVMYTFPDDTTKVAIGLPPVHTNILKDPEHFQYTVTGVAAASPPVFRCCYVRDIHDVMFYTCDSQGGEHDVLIRFEAYGLINGYDAWTWYVRRVTDVDISCGVMSLDGLRGFEGNGYILFAPTGKAIDYRCNRDLRIVPNSLADMIAVRPTFYGMTQDTVIPGGYANQKVEQDGYGYSVTTP